MARAPASSTLTNGGPYMLKLYLWWDRVRNSLWFVPGTITIGCAILAVTLVQLEAHDRLSWTHDAAWLFSGGASGARGVLGAIAGSLITVTGVAFSVTIVALQLASSQFSPRVLHGFIGDRVNQLTLGMLIGTFTYSLLVMRSIRSASDDRVLFVPVLAVTIGIVLLLISVAQLILFINHSATSIRVEFIVERQASRVKRQLAKRFPDGAQSSARDRPATLPVPATTAGEVVAREGGYLQAVHQDALVALAVKRDALLQVARSVGEFVLPGEPIVRVWPLDALDDDMRDDVCAAVALGTERTAEQDLEFGIVGIADVAVRALSPGINDPTTALLCVDRLAGLVAEIAGHAEPVTVRFGDDGAPRLLLNEPGFDRVVSSAFDAIARAGARDLSVTLHLLRMLQRLGPLVPPTHRPPLAREALTAGGEAQGQLVDVRAREAVALALADTLAWLGESAQADRGTSEVRRGDVAPVGATGP